MGAATGVMTDASPKAQWLEDRLGGGVSLVSSRGRHSLNISYAPPDRGEAAYSGGGGGENGS